MEGTTDQTRTLPLVRDAGLLAQAPFVLLDAGCSGGIDGVWRIFGEDLVAFGFDPQRSECRRLQQAETRPGVEYVPAFVGLARDHPFLARRAQEDRKIKDHFEPWSRLSTAEAVKLGAKASQQSQPIFEDWVSLDDIVPLDAFVRDRKLATVDFIKIDVDGTDLDVALSAESITRSHQVLGFAIEVNWTGSHLETENSFHNIDRNMRRMGYSLVGATHRTYSRRDLPAPFVYDVLAQTHGGQPIQGDVIYLRDAASEHDAAIWGAPLGPHKLLKLLALYEMCRVPDMAAELLNVRRDALSGLIDVDRLLDALTPPRDGQPQSYRDYIAAFRADPTMLLPKNRTQPDAGTSERPCDDKRYGLRDLARMLADGTADAARDWLPWLVVDTAGEATTDGIAASLGREGYVCSGPYWPLRAGLYRMTVALATDTAGPADPDAPIGLIDIADAGDAVASMPLLARHLREGVVLLPFAVEAPGAEAESPRIETRIRSAGLASFRVTSVRIEPRIEPVVIEVPAAAPEPAPPPPPLPPLPPLKRALVALTPPILLRALRRAWRSLR
jgi:hypothetical protein